MHNEAFGREPALQIETLYGSEGNQVSVCPERGGIITSIMIDNTEILYPDPNNFQSEKIRGGIPIMFPNAGPDEEGLPQHGFARDSKWEVVKNDGGELVGVLEVDKKTQEIFAHDFRLEMRMRVEQDGSVSLLQKVSNKSEGDFMPISMGLHPYFPVAEQQKKEFLSDLIGKEKAGNSLGEWLGGEAISIDNPGILTLPLSEKFNLRMKISQEYKKIWLWTLPGQDFVCVEPVMGDVGNIRNNPTLVSSEKPFIAWVNFSKEE